MHALDSARVRDGAADPARATDAGCRPHRSPTAHMRADSRTNRTSAARSRSGSVSRRARSCGRRAAGRGVRNRRPLAEQYPSKPTTGRCKSRAQSTAIVDLQELLSPLATTNCERCGASAYTFADSSGRQQKNGFLSVHAATRGTKASRSTKTMRHSTTAFPMTVFPTTKMLTPLEDETALTRSTPLDRAVREESGFSSSTTTPTSASASPSSFGAMALRSRPRDPEPRDSRPSSASVPTSYCPICRCRMATASS